VSADRAGEHVALVLDTLRGLLAEVDPSRARGTIDPDQSLTRDLALGSLERVELAMRLEQASGVALGETVLAEADTARQIAAAIDRAKTAPGPEPRPEPRAEPGPQPGPQPRARPGAQPGAQPRAQAWAQPAEVRRNCGPASRARTLVDVLRWQVDRGAERVHIRLRGDDGAETEITYGSLYRDGLAVAAGLRSRGVVPGERVALLLRTEPAFFHAYVGILLAGAVPVPLYPPFRADQIEEYAARQAAILRNAGARILLTFAEAERAAALLRPLAPTLTTVATVPDIRDDAAGLVPVDRGEDALALIQYTSGSTGSPKGVALSHANLLANVRAFGEAFEMSGDDVGVTWLPLYHDMGLIGAWFGPLYHGIPIVSMSPLAFLARPVRWLEAISRHRGTITAAPNFAFDLCARKITDADLQGIDLSSWRVALNGAEAVLAGTIERFTARFAPHGFRPEAMRPVYGLAEGSLCVTAPPPGRLPRIARLSRDAFQHARAIEPAAPDDPQPLAFVACGRPIPRHELRIVDDREAPQPARVEGRIQFRGPSSMQGYFENPEATAAVVRDGGWIDTGDLGFVDDDGDLFVTGRAKDVIIAGGRNIYPQEVEEAVADVPGIRRGCVAAFGVQDGTSGTERLVVVAETRGAIPPGGSPLHAAVGAAIVAAIGVPADTIVFARPGSVPKTSSGKIRRSTTRDLYEGGRLHRGRASAAWQWARLIGRHVTWRVGRALSFAGTLLYSAWIWIAVALVALPLWIAVALARTPRQARRVIGAASRLLLLAGGCRPRLDGRDPGTLPAPAVIVANHASFLDVLLLLAVLPPTVRFAAKASLIRYPILGTILHRAGYVLVQRGSRDSTAALATTIDDGDSLFVFPEGTFVRAPGVMPFRLGAFQVAVEKGVPVVAIALRGTRAVWPDETLRLRPGPLTVAIAEPRTSSGTGWASIVALRDAARTWIADASGEPAVSRGGVMIDVPGHAPPAPD
jgi:1-acyl-sn-glycerol-3-phosphate acyltransferase